MASDGGKHTRLPCLATVRSLVAIVVTVLAVAVVVMLIYVVHRPVKVSLELPQGYIRAENQWVAKTKCFAQPAKDVKLRVLLRILNPSGRGDITCNITSMVVFDMPNSYSMGMNISETFYPEKPRPFSVSQHASHTLLQRMIISDTDALNYMYKKYKGENSLNTMVRVNITCKALSLAGGTDIDNHDCWPVKVIHGVPDDDIDMVTCKKTKEIVYPLLWQPPTPPAAPAPAPAPMGSAC